MHNCTDEAVEPRTLEPMEDSISAWEDEGGLQAPSPGESMTGTANQIMWAVTIKRQVDAEFDRVRRALETRRDTETIIAILEEKRAEVMAREDAGYFIHDWQELRNQVTQMILADSRYKGARKNNLAFRRR